MQPDRNPTFAEALLASAVVAIAADKQNGITWKRARQIARDALDGAAPWVEPVPKEIRRALGADKQMSEPYDGLPIGHLISLIASAKRGDPIQQADVDALEEWRSTRSPVVDKQPVIEPRELALEKQLADAQQDARDATTMIAQAHREKAAAVARAEKAEEQMRHDSDARQMAEAGRASAVEAMCASERKCDALRAELDKAKADVMAANLRARTAQDERDDIKAKLADAVARAEKAEAALERITRTRVDTVCPYCNEHLCSHGISETEREIVTSHAKVCPKHPNREVERERDDLRDELDSARAAARGEAALRCIAECERDALAAKLAEKEAARVRIYNELIAYQHERDRLAGIADRAGRVLDEVAAREARLDAKEHG